jgi:GNAT superfamily N-acetyltransferase
MTGRLTVALAFVLSTHRTRGGAFLVGRDAVPQGKPTVTLGVMEIRTLSPGDMDSACEVIGLAFADNPNTLAAVRGDRSRASRMMRAAARTAKLGRRYSHVLVADEGGDVVGVLNAAEWPNCQLGLSEKVRTAPVMIRCAGWALPRSLKQMSVWAKHDPRERHWHLGPIGVHPEMQGRGVGKALLSAFLRTVDEQRSPAYLETDVDQNAVLYARFGFTVIGQAEINGVNNRFMWRPAVLRQ